MKNRNFLKGTHYVLTVDPLVNGLRGPSMPIVRYFRIMCKHSPKICQTVIQYCIYNINAYT